MFIPFLFNNKGRLLIHIKIINFFYFFIYQTNKLINPYKYFEAIRKNHSLY
jgi:hypothetical protein